MKILVGCFKGENPRWLWSRRTSLDVTEIISSLFPGKCAQKVFFVWTKSHSCDARRKCVCVGGSWVVCVSSVQWSQREASGVCEALLSQHIPSPSTTSRHPPSPNTHTRTDAAASSRRVQLCCWAEPHPQAIAHRAARLGAKECNPAGLLLTLRLTLQVISSVSCKKPGLSNHTVISAEKAELGQVRPSQNLLLRQELFHLFYIFGLLFFLFPPVDCKAAK